MVILKWHGKMELIAGVRHAIPIHQSDQLHLLFEAFLRDIEEK